MKIARETNIWWLRAALVACVFLLPVAGFATCAHAISGDSPSEPASARVSSQFAIADFDGDSRPDIATVEVGESNSSATRYWIDFRLSTGWQQTVGIAAPTGGLQLRSRDVNGDSFPDVIVTTLWTGQPVAVLLNDGRGNFRQSEPSAFPDAFGNFESSLSSPTERTTDTAALVFSRYPPGQCEEREETTSPACLVGRSPAGSFQFVFTPFSDSSFGRAPPSVAPHF